MNATTTPTRTHSFGQRSVVFAALLALLSWSFILVTPLTAGAEHDVEEAGPRLDAAVAPTFVDGNPTCGDFYTTTEFKVEGEFSSGEDVQSGTYHFDEDGSFLSYASGDTPQTDEDAHFSVHIQVYPLEDDTWEGPVFDFLVLTDHEVHGVVAKGGPDANLYDYGGADDTHAPTSEADGSTVTADETLHSPHNQDNRFYGVSHISFCAGEAPEEPALHDLSVTKTVDGGPLGEGDTFEFVLYPTDAEDDPVVAEGVTRTVTAQDDTATWTDLEDGDYWLCETGLEEGWSIGWPEGLAGESVTVDGDTFECVVVVVDGDDVSFTVDNISPDEEPALHDLSVTKTVDGGPLGEGDTFEFVLYPTDAEDDPVVAEGVTRTVTAQDDTATWTDLEDGDYWLCETGLEEGWSIGWPEGLAGESVTVDGDTFECVVVVVDGDDVSFTVDNISPDEPIEPVGIVADITKTNDADGDDEFSEEEFAENEGDAVDFQLEVFNDNSVDVVIVELTDSYDGIVIDLLTGAVTPDGAATLTTNTCADLDGATIPANDSVTCTFTLEGYAPAEGEAVTNVAFVELQDPETGETADADDTSLVETVEQVVLPGELEPDIDLVKEADVTEAEVGDVITYTYTVTNTGNTTLTDITLDDDVLGEIGLESTTLEPGESTTGTATHTVTEDDLEVGEVFNIAIVTGWPLEGDPVTDEDDETVVVLGPDVVEAVLAEELPATGFDTLQALFAALLALSLGGVTLLGARLHELRGRMYGTA